MFADTEMPTTVDYSVYRASIFNENVSASNHRVVFTLCSSLELVALSPVRAARDGGGNERPIVCSVGAPFDVVMCCRP